MKNTDEQSLETLRALSIGINSISGEIYPSDSPYQEAHIKTALISAITELEKAIKRSQRNLQVNGPSNAGQPWSIDEEKKLKRDFDSGKKVKELVEQYGRTEGGIRSRLAKLLD
jgi:hypothetical protein